MADPVQLLMGVRQSRQIPFSEDGGAEARFGEDHHPCCALDQMGAGA